MSGPNFDALGAHAAGIFDGLAHNVQDASSAINVSETILESVLRALRKRHSVWNDKNSHCRLPAEVLASCFEYLSFSDKIAATHVSRSWRAAALAFPSVWADLDLPAVRHASSLFEMFLDRAGKRPVDLSFPEAHVLHSAEGVLARHLHRFRSITWHDPRVRPETFDRPAPALERLSYPHTLKISEGFLGGQPGRLRELELHEMFLPDRAPALGSVTVLSAHVPWDPAVTFLQLFDLFPRLQSLALRHLPIDAATRFPRSPAPPSLTQLYLDADYNATDAVQLYAAWKTERLSQVTISALLARPDISPLVSDARRLVVDVPREGTARLTSINSRDHHHTLVLAHPRDGPDSILKGLRHRDAAPALDRLEALEISLAEFAGLTTVNRVHHPRLSSLKYLTLRIYEYINPYTIPGTQPSRVFRWELLEALRDLREVHIELQAFVLEVHCDDDAHFPTHSDALALLERLPDAVEGGISSVCIRGFPSAAVRDLDPNIVPGLHIVFEAL